MTTPDPSALVTRIAKVLDESECINFHGLQSWSEEALAVMQEATIALTQLQAERDKLVEAVKTGDEITAQRCQDLQARLTALEAALAQREHASHCSSRYLSVNGDSQSCDCWLKPVVAARTAAREKL